MPQNHKKKNSKKDKDNDDSFHQMVADIQISEEEANRRKTEVDQVFIRHGVAPLPSGPATSEPDIPPCDYCGTNWTGNFKCSRCDSAFYCSQKCQVEAWKKGNHKRECSSMRESCQTAAKLVVDTMKNKALTPGARVEHFKRVDGAGPYRIALDQLSMNEAIRGMLLEDTDGVVQRYQSHYDATSFVEWIMCTLFRGGRQEGYGSENGAFSGVDPYRCKSYVMSSPDAFEIWFQASLTSIAVFCDPQIRRHKQLELIVLRSMRNVAAAWSMVFQDNRISKAIILGISKKNDEAAVNRGKWMVKELKGILKRFWTIDNGTTIESHLNQVAGMIKIRLEEHGVNVGDFVKQLGVKGSHKTMFLKMGVPFARATIEKGRALTTDEASKVMKGRSWNS